MRISFKTFSLVSLLALSPILHADDEAPVTRGEQNHYVGVGMWDDMLHINGEMVTDYGNFVVRAGKFTQKTHGVVGNIGWRKPLTAEDGHSSGYYMGVFAGHVQTDTLAGELFNRVGGGVDLGYHWVNAETRKIFSVGVGTAEPIESGGKKKAAQPYVYFNFSAAVGF